MNHRLERSIGLLVALAIVWPAYGDQLDDALFGQMPTLIERCQARGVSKVAVLPFRLRPAGKPVPTEPDSMSRAALCKNLPTRIENTLALKLKSRAPELLILSTVGAGAKDRHEAGAAETAEHNRLLQLEMTPLWGGANKVRPDALIYGELAPSSDRRTLRVMVRACDAREEFELLEFDVAIDRNLLAELGQGFSLGSAAVRAITDGTIFAEVAADVAQTLKHPPATAGQPPTRNIVRERIEPQTSPEFPVEFDLFYDNRPQELALDDASLGSHNYLAPEPAANQSLTFGVRNNTQQPVGVVLLVNGVSTLREQQGEAAGLNKWVLNPSTEYRIKGYHQQGNEKYRTITAFTHEESLRRYEDLGGERFAGLIHLFVFRTIDTKPETVPMFVLSIGRLLHTDGVATEFDSLRDLQQAIARRSDLFPPGTRPLAGWGKEMHETLAEQQLGQVTLTDVLLVRYSSTRPVSSANAD